MLMVGAGPGNREALLGINICGIIITSHAFGNLLL